MLYLGNLFYVSCLLINAVAILSEDRFLARISLSPASYDPAFGAGADSQSVQAKIVHLIASVRTLMRMPLIVANTLIIIYELVLG
ncbi:Putative Yos1-like protein [[Torrubiella] hemipterigena]|uniref:Putative Yos1-like protein n=1 Tax=[Torrubiella] hemipterigena TaxID=1531966 RepID=A0A0A1STL7_9HYPO|nr:Putative Yos1-like protein [[Torrubiella] hemipterigena]